MMARFRNRTALRLLILMVVAPALLHFGRRVISRSTAPECCQLLNIGEASAQESPDTPLGGDIIPLRQVSDPYPVFNGLAIDPVNDLVAMTDVNRKSLLSYTRSENSTRGGINTPRRQVFGPRTNIGFVAGILVDEERKEIFAVN